MFKEVGGYSYRDTTVCAWTGKQEREQEKSCFDLQSQALVGALSEGDSKPFVAKNINAVCAASSFLQKTTATFTDEEYSFFQSFTGQFRRVRDTEAESVYKSKEAKEWLLVQAHVSTRALKVLVSGASHSANLAVLYLFSEGMLFSRVAHLDIFVNQLNSYLDLTKKDSCLVQASCCVVIARAVHSFVLERGRLGRKSGKLLSMIPALLSVITTEYFYAPCDDTRLRTLISKHAEFTFEALIYRKKGAVRMPQALFMECIETLTIFGKKKGSNWQKVHFTSLLFLLTHARFTKVEDEDIPRVLGCVERILHFVTFAKDQHWSWKWIEENPSNELYEPDSSEIPLLFKEAKVLSNLTRDILNEANSFIDHIIDAIGPDLFPQSIVQKIGDAFKVEGSLFPSDWKGPIVERMVQRLMDKFNSTRSEGGGGEASGTAQ